MSRELAMLPPRTQMWPELDNSSDVCGFRGIEAVEMAAAMWPRNPDGRAPVEFTVPGRGCDPGCECATCLHGAAGSNEDRTYLLYGAQKFEGPRLRRRRYDPTPHDADADREFWQRARADGYQTACKWWRLRGTQEPLPLDPSADDGEDLVLKLPMRRSSALVIAPGLLTVKWSSAPTGESDEDILACADDCTCPDCEAFRALFTPDDADGDPTAVDDRVITGFSARSKGRMMRFVASVDWASIREPNERLVGITLTYPGGDWRRWAPSPAAVLSHLTAFCKRFERATGRPMRCVWVREFQERGAPHYHLCALAPTHIKGKPFRMWQSRAWYEVVGSGEHTHLQAGTRIDFKTSLGMAIDPKRAAAYFGGYTSKNKAYQHDAPEGWTNDNGSVGAYWGRRGVNLATSEVAISPENVIQIKRIMRRMIRAQKRTVTVRVGRNYETQTVLDGQAVVDGGLPDGTMLTSYGHSRTITKRIPQRTRRVTRRWRLKSLAPQGPAADGQRGFTVFANDAPLLAAQLARVIHPNQPPWPKGQRRPLP